MKTKHLIAVGAIVLGGIGLVLVVANSLTKTAISCDNPAVIAVLKELVQKTIQPNLNTIYTGQVLNMDLDVSAVAPLSFDDAINRYVCQAM